MALLSEKLSAARGLMQRQGKYAFETPPVEKAVD
jgi:hypothetical protein